MMGDCLLDHTGIVFSFLIAILLAVGFGAMKAEEAQRNAFMQECLTERKQYECTAMWRAGERSGSGLATGIAVGTAVGIAAGRR